jgi:predicted Zn-dependent protease with MMP-like domain
MTTPYQIPLVASQQQLQVALGGIVYTLTVRWNDAAGSWTVDIGDSANNLIIGGIPLVTGTDLLGQYAYLGFGGKLVAQTDFDADAVPTYTNLGTNGNLFFVTEP